MLAESWHLQVQVIAAKLTQVRESKIRRLIINLLSRHLGKLRTHRATLGHCQQGDRAQRFLGLHNLGAEGQGSLTARSLPQTARIPRAETRRREQQGMFNAEVVLIEDKASGTQLIQELIVEGCYSVTRYQPKDEETMRLHAQTAMIENGFVHIPESASWLSKYLHEMTVFPNGKHDDQVDSTAYARWPPQLRRRPTPRSSPKLHHQRGR